MLSTHTFGSQILFTYGAFHIGHRDAGFPCCHREPLEKIGEGNWNPLLKWWLGLQPKILVIAVCRLKGYST